MIYSTPNAKGPRGSIYPITPAPAPAPAKTRALALAPTLSLRLTLARQARQHRADLPGHRVRLHAGRALVRVGARVRVRDRVGVGVGVGFRVRVRDRVQTYPPATDYDFHAGS